MKDKPVKIGKVEIKPDIELVSFRGSFGEDIGICKYTYKYSILHGRCKDERTDKCFECKHFHGNRDSEPIIESGKSYFESIRPVG